MSDDAHPLAALYQEQMALNAKFKAAWEAYQPDKIGEYTFTSSSGEPVTLSSLFGDKNRLLLVHNMGFN